MFDDIHGSFPSPLERPFRPEDERYFQGLPEEYRRFLEAHNGGFTDEFRYTFLTGVPFKTEEVDNPSRNDCPIEFFGIPTTDAPGEWPEDLLQMVADHAAEEFLPSGVIAIARCVQNSLVCISLRDEDRGSIYYWDWYWRYPWCSEFFEKRIDEARARIEEPEKILENRADPRYQDVVDALNFATLVKLAASLSEWFRSCEDRRSEA